MIIHTILKPNNKLEESVNKGKERKCWSNCECAHQTQTRPDQTKPLLTCSAYVTFLPYVTRSSSLPYSNDSNFQIFPSHSIFIFPTPNSVHVSKSITRTKEKFSKDERVVLFGRCFAMIVQFQQLVFLFVPSAVLSANTKDF
ncbi:hypothetical protein RIF29_20104 [Crotalaria pallida]|uniref:Uncharacterized protein n=1 Tax=Crotalaria pallida TaxID=3830 RepID=A0AAN9I8C5_CROPI